MKINNLERINNLMEDWGENPRWSGVARPYTAAEVVRLSGTVKIDRQNHTETSEPDAFLPIFLSPVRAGGRRPVGLIGIGCEDLDHEHSQVLILAGSMIAQALRIEHGIRGERERLREENTHLKQELKEKYDFSHIVGNSNAMKLVYEQISQVAKSNATVLLRGESGTGKEMIANAIHYNSLRSKRPLVKINCAALPETLIESELFGHEKGAFTGADRFKIPAEHAARHRPGAQRPGRSANRHHG